MKKIVAAIAVAGTLAGANALACGGMTQVYPPQMKFHAGSMVNDNSISILDLAGAHVLVIC